MTLLGQAFAEFRYAIWDCKLNSELLNKPDMVIVDNRKKWEERYKEQSDWEIITTP